MATLSAFFTLNPIYRTKPQTCRIVIFPSRSLTLPTKAFHLQSNEKKKGFSRSRILSSVEGETFVTEQGTEDSTDLKIQVFETRQGVWEDPDDGSGSEYDDDEEDEQEEENDLDFESDWEEENDGIGATVSGDKSASNKYEEDLVKEVEQLLRPEERAILEQNTTPNLGKISTAKWKPLQTLALSGQIPVMDKLLENGLDIDTVDKDGLTALHKAIIGKKEAVISHLLRKGANPHVKDQDGATPLHYAVQVGALQTVKLLIKYKADVNAADNEGWTPLHIAVQSRHRVIAKVLLTNGADKTRKSKDGKTALDMSLCYGKDFKSYDLAKLLKILPANRDL